MASVNQVILVGNIGQDPEVRFTQKGDAILSFSVATTEKYKDKEETQWHNVSVFAPLSNAVKDYVVKGRQVYIQGQLVYEKWNDKDGNKRTSTKIKVGFGGKLMLLGKGDGGAPQERRSVEHPGNERVGSQSGTGAEVPFQATDDDIPF